MSNGFSMTTDQAHEVARAFGHNGWNSEQVKRACQGDLLKQVLDVLLGCAEIKPIEHDVDLGTTPLLPDGWKAQKHQKGKAAKLARRGDGLYLDGRKIEFRLSRSQREIGIIGGNELRKEVARLPALNANVLDFLLKNPHLIPDSWKTDTVGNTLHVYFWGTIYRNSGGDLCVRYLSWDGERWDWGYDWLGVGWYSYAPAAVSAC